MSATPGINETLVRTYAQGATETNVKNLLTLFDALKRDRDRAEELSRAYLAQLTRQTKELQGLRDGERSVPAGVGTGPGGGRPTAKTNSAPTPRAAPKIQSSELDLGGI